MAKQNKNYQNLKIVLFCGGTGTRMWPMSRKKRPKQFQPLVGNESMFQAAVRRIKKGFPVKDVFVVTGRDYVGLVVNQAPDIPLENIIIEPDMRDTLAAVGFAAAVLDKKFKNPAVAALWAADHLVKNDDEFIKALKCANAYVQDSGKIVSIDVRPTYPNVHVGYIKIGKMITKTAGSPIFEYIKQIEKPSLADAKKYVSGWEYLWHAGYKVWKTQKMLSLYKKHVPKVYEDLMKIQKAWGSDKQEDVIKKIYPQFEKISVDYAIFEKINPQEVVVLPADLGWSDVGAWNILKDELANDPQDNVIKGNVIDVGSQDCLIYETSSNKVIATVGLNEIIIVDTDDGLLVCAKDRVPDVKKFIEKLKEKKLDEYL